MTKTINEFIEILKDVFSIGKDVFPSEINKIIAPIIAILVVVLIYKIIRKALI